MDPAKITAHVCFFSSSKQFTPKPKLKTCKRLVFHSLLSLLARFSATATMTSVSIGKDRKSSRLLITHSIHAELIVGRIGHSKHKLIVWHPVGGIERQLFPSSFIMDAVAAVAAASDCTGDIRQTKKKKDTGFGHFPIFPITEWSGVLFFYLFWPLNDAYRTGSHAV